MPSIRWGDEERVNVCCRSKQSIALGQYKTAHAFHAYFAFDYVVESKKERPPWLRDVFNTRHGRGLPRSCLKACSTPAPAQSDFLSTILAPHPRDQRDKVYPVSLGESPARFLLPPSGAVVHGCPA